MQNKFKVRSIAEEAGIPLTKTIVAGAVRLEVEKPLDELVAELREAGLL